MKKISAALFLTAALSLGVSAYAQTTNPTGQVDPPNGQATNQKPAELTDVPAGHWASAAVQIAANCGIVRGFPDGTFRGNEPITRYQAAVIIARLLEVIKNGECGLPGSGATSTISAEEFAALQNAVQELSADLAQLGVRVAELEDNAVTQDDLARVEEIATQARDLADQAIAGIPEGVDTSNFVMQDDLANYATLDDLARVEELANEARDLAQAAADATGTGDTGTGVDPQALQDLADQVEAASIAADTALAQARDLQDNVDELSGRVDDLESQLGELGATVESQADSIAALNDLVVLLNQDVLSLQDRVTELERQVADQGAALDEASSTYASQDDLESLREFTTLLRRDQTALSDRVGELENRVGALENRVNGIDARVTTLENNAFTVSGSLGLNYWRSTTWDNAGAGVGPNFDVDRLFFGARSTGFISDDRDGDGSDNARDYGDFGRRSANTAWDLGTYLNLVVDRYNKTPAGTGIHEEGAVRPSLSLNFGLKPRALVGGTTNGIGNTFSIELNLEFLGAGNYSVPSDGSNWEDGLFEVTSLATKYNIGGAPLFINFGIKPAFKFTNYGFNNGDGRGDGFVATIDGAGLPLNLGLTVVYGSRWGLNGDYVYYEGVRGTASLIPGITGGIYYGVEGPDIIDPLQGPNTTNLFGLDFAAKVGPISLDGEYNVGITGGNPGQVAGYARAKVDLGVFTVGANYRVVDADFFGISASVDGALRSDGFLFRKNQRGFGIDLGLNLGFLKFAFYYDQRVSQDPTRVVGHGGENARFFTDINPGARGSTDFGFTVTLRLIGFDIAPYWNRENEYGAGGTSSPVRDRTRYGVNLTHDGTKADALIKGLNFAAGYRVQIDTLAPADESTLYVYADTTLNLLGLAITPRGYFSQVTTNGASFRGGDDVTNYGGSLQVKGGFLFGSTISLGAAIDQSNHSASGGYVSNTYWGMISLSFNPSIFGTPSTFSVAYANRVDLNRTGMGFGPSLASPVGDRSWAGSESAGYRSAFNAGDFLGVGTNLSGLYFNFSYYGLNFYYGIFALVDYRFKGPNGAFKGDPGAITFGQTFSISYTLKF